MAWPHPLTAHCIPSFSLSVTSALLHKRARLARLRLFYLPCILPDTPPPPLFLPELPSGLSSDAAPLLAVASALFSFITHITL